MDTGAVAGFMIGTLVGVVIGASAALMLAPKSGEDLRAHLRAEADSEMRRVREEMNSRVQELNNKLDQARNELASEISSRLQTKPASE